MALRFQKTLIEQLQQHGEEMYPRECCGVLVGEFLPGESEGPALRMVRRVVPCGNACTDLPETRYRIDPADLVRIQREARLQGHVILGFYHSHPDWPAQWSRSDIEEAHWTGCSYVITSVEHGRAVHTNSFMLQGGDESKHFEEETIELY